MDKAPTVIDLAIELAEHMVNHTPPVEALTRNQLYEVYLKRCREAGREPWGRKTHKAHLDRMVENGELVGQMFGNTIYYWRPDGR